MCLIPSLLTSCVNSNSNKGDPMKSQSNRRLTVRRVCSRPMIGSQRGSVLIIGLIMMLILTMIGLTGMQTTTQQEKMSGNLRDRNVAFQAAELALRHGERVVATTLGYKNLPMSGNGLYDFSNPAVIPYHDPIMNNAESLRLMADDDTWLNSGAYRTEVIEYPEHLEGASQRPAYIIVRMPDPVASKSLKVAQERDKELYKVTARGVGASESAVVVMQSTFVPQDCSVPANCP